MAEEPTSCSSTTSATSGTRSRLSVAQRRARHQGGNRRGRAADLSAYAIDLVLLDIMMPGETGWR
jgi:CheY-like chemotaxis protein